MGVGVDDDEVAGIEAIPDRDSGEQTPFARENTREGTSLVMRTRARARWIAVGAVAVTVVVAAAFLVAVRGSSDRASRQTIAATLAAEASALTGTSPHLAAQLAAASYGIDPSYVAQDALFHVALDNATVERVIGGTGHAINALAEDRDGTEVYAASSDGSVIGWDMTTGDQLARTRLSSTVQALAADPNGPYLAGVDGRGDVLLWHTGARSLGKPTTIALGVEQTGGVPVIGLGFFEGGDLAYVLYGNGYAVTCNVLTGRYLDSGYVANFAAQRHISYPSGTSLTAASQAIIPPGAPAAAMVYVATTDNRILAINLKTFRLSVTLRSSLLPSNPTSVAVLPGTARTIEVSGTSGVTMWDTATGREIQDYPVSTLGAGFDADGSVMAAQTSTGVALIGISGGYTGTGETTTAGGTTTTSGTSGVQSGQLYGGAVEAMAVPTSDGTLIAAGAADGSISVINPAESRLQLPSAPGTPVLAFDQRGNLILSGAYNGNRTTDLYSIHPPDGYSSGSYAMVRTYDPASSWWPAGDEFYTNDAVVGGGLLIAAGQDPFGHGVVLVWNEVTGRPVRELKLSGSPALGVDVRYDPRLRLIVVRDSNGQVDAWSVGNWRQVAQIALGTATGNIALSPDGLTVAAALQYGESSAAPAGQASKLALIDLRTHSLREKTLASAFYRTAYAPDGSRLALAGDNVVRFVSPAGGTISGAPVIQLPGTPENMSYSPDGRLLAVALIDGRTAIYDTTTGQLAYPPIPGGQGNQAANVAWNPSGTLLAIALGQQAGQYLEASTTALWQVDPRVWARQDCSLAGGNLTPAQWRAYVGSSIPYTQPCAPARAAQGQGLDLRQLDWAGVTVPAKVCSGTGNVQLHQGEATIGTRKYGRVSVEAQQAPVYGRLSARGPDVAALSVWCLIGGTAASEVAQGFVIYDGSQGYPRVIGILTPQHQTSGGVHVPYLTRVTIQPGKIIAYEAWYTSKDPDCCPSGRAATAWLYQDGRLAPQNTQVTAG
jgi:WD40 repeat protein